MHIVRDASWDRMLHDAQKHYGTTDVSEQCVRLANATWRCVAKAREMREQRSARSVSVLASASSVSTKKKRTSAGGFCQGKTKSGQSCRFKASCDGFCKKHITL